jgi:virginiamycin B lyase
MGALYDDRFTVPMVPGLINRTGRGRLLILGGLLCATILWLLMPALAARAAAGTITLFPIPDVPIGITVGPDNAHWFTEAGGKIGRRTVAGTLTEFALPAGHQGSAITSGPDGALWFTEVAAGRIGRITTAGVITEFLLPGNVNSPEPNEPQERPFSITSGPDGALWYTANLFNEQGTGPTVAFIGRITTAGSFTEFTLPGGGTRRTTLRPQGITTGPDGALWFADANASLHNVGRITTAGVVTLFPTPSGTPNGITRGPDGNLWFTANSTNFSGQAIGQVGRVTTAGVFTLFTAPTGGLNGASFSDVITAGPDGNLWTADYDLTLSAGAILRVTTAGVFTRFQFPTFDQVNGMTAGPDTTNMWFSWSNNQATTGAIGKITTV